MNDPNQLAHEVRDLIGEMDRAKLTGDDGYIDFYDRYRALMKKLEEEPSSEKTKELSAALAKSFEKLSGQLGFCTLP